MYFVQEAHHHVYLANAQHCAEVLIDELNEERTGYPEAVTPPIEMTNKL